MEYHARFFQQNCAGFCSREVNFTSRVLDLVTVEQIPARRNKFLFEADKIQHGETKSSTAALKFVPKQQIAARADKNLSGGANRSADGVGVTSSEVNSGWI